MSPALAVSARRIAVPSEPTAVVKAINVAWHADGWFVEAVPAVAPSIAHWVTEAALDSDMAERLTQRYRSAGFFERMGMRLHNAK
ncbi:hypothetical protein ACOCG7_09485 [Paraburkholderia sp. DD10]|uniref:hypothetical protein n=1 Tax=Burkholderiaceae TaxID=119060 RepID=UPI00157B88D0|nr:hypothetical protein [Burkholderia metallica]NTZ83346.1 hypothetical protein [Burkholderia metallica]